MDNNNILLSLQLQQTTAVQPVVHGIVGSKVYPCTSQLPNGVIWQLSIDCPLRLIIIEYWDYHYFFFHFFLGSTKLSWFDKKSPKTSFITSPT